MPRKRKALITGCRSCGSEFGFKKSPNCEDCQHELQIVLKRHRREIERLLNRLADSYTFEMDNDKGEPDGYQEPVLSESQARALEKLYDQDEDTRYLMQTAEQHSYGSGWVDVDLESADSGMLPLDERGRTVVYNSSTGLIQDDVDVKTPRLPGGIPLGCSTTDAALQQWLLARLKEVSSHEWFGANPLWQFDSASDVRQQLAAEVKEAKSPRDPALNFTKLSESAKAGLRKRERNNGV